MPDKKVYYKKIPYKIIHLKKVHYKKFHYKKVSGKKCFEKIIIKITDPLFSRNNNLN